MRFHLPIDDSFFMQKPQARYNFGGIEFSTRLRKSATHLYVKHQITAIQIFHHEEQMALEITGNTQTINKQKKKIQIIQRYFTHNLH